MTLQVTCTPAAASPLVAERRKAEAEQAEALRFRNLRHLCCARRIFCRSIEIQWTDHERRRRGKGRRVQRFRHRWQWCSRRAGRFESGDALRHQSRIIDPGHAGRIRYLAEHRRFLRSGRIAR